MRIANLRGRLVLVDGARASDVEAASGGRFSADPQSVYDRWTDFCEWAAATTVTGWQPFDESDLGAPTPQPRQVFAIGLNYSEHVAETDFAIPEGEPPVFTKFATSITGPRGDIALPPGGHTDWEVELVAVIGRRAEHVSVDAALDHIAGYTIGQDISERSLQLAASPPQFSLGKSYPGFAPVGPYVVTLDEFADPNDVGLECWIGDELVQSDRTRKLIFSVPALIAKLSAVLPLLPGDLIFTGTPAGVGMGRDPQRWLQPGDQLVTRIENIGEMRHRLVG